jgi:hypothetical protein
LYTLTAAVCGRTISEQHYVVAVVPSYYSHSELGGNTYEKGKFVSLRELYSKR